jgi:ornithine cyclodeaminase/alanine dehydrogenase-like protein (mu-crystallin family)
MNAKMLYLSAEDVCRTLPMPEAVEAMRDAFVQLSSGQVTLPTRQHMDVPCENGVALVMPCHSTVQKYFCVKFITLFRGNRLRGLPLIQSLVILSDGATGEHLAVLDGVAVTAIRTGAASGLATQVLARSDAAAVAVFGGGVQARTQLEAVCHVRPIGRASVYDPEHAAADRFAAEMTERLGLPVRRAETPAAVLEGADVICAATTSSIPIFEDRELPPGAHINAIGSYRPEVTEIPAATVCRARVVVDHRASAMEEAGDLLGPLRQGLIEPSHFSTELGEILLGRSPGRRSGEEITLFKSVGVAIQDLCAAARALENARRLNLGMPLPLGGGRLGIA